MSDIENKYGIDGPVEKPKGRTEWWIGVCGECHSPQPGDYMARSKFEQPPCKFCGGVTITVPADEPDILEGALSKIDTQRGVYRKPAPQNPNEVSDSGDVYYQ
jgi:hypothetical protein